MRKTTIILILVLSNILTYGQVNYDSIHSFDFNKKTVLDYVKILPIKDTNEMKSHIIITLGIAGYGWIKDSDLDTLIKLIDSKDKANCVVQAISSSMPTNEESTLGGQIMNLIDAYRFKKEYPYFLTDCSKNDEKRKYEILKWWFDKNKYK